jgi:proteic killer suppression protein
LIKTFRGSETERVWNQQFSRKFQAIERIASRKLYQVNRATTLQDLAAIPGNKLEVLAGDRKGQYSIRINDQYRICFEWKEPDAYNVEIVDYHD